MAETYSQEYQNLYITKPPVKTEHIGVGGRKLPFTYTQLLAGAAADTVVLQTLPPRSMLLLPDCVFYFAGFTSGMTLSVGWRSYTDADGVVQALSATGLFNAVAVSNGTGILNGGMMSIATAVSVNPVVTAVMKDFRNATPVDIFATFNTQAPGAAAVLNGYLEYLNLA